MILQTCCLCVTEQHDPCKHRHKRVQAARANAPNPARREEEARRGADIAAMEEAALAAEGAYGGLREEAAAKTRKLEKLRRRVAVGVAGCSSGPAAAAR
jgi:hypothetical protein